MLLPKALQNLQKGVDESALETLAHYRAAPEAEAWLGVFSMPSMLIAGSLMKRFQQAEWTPVFERCVRAYRLPERTSELLREPGGGCEFHDALAFTVLLNGHVERETESEIRECFELAISIDERKEWSFWHKRAWELSWVLMTTAYWLADETLARRVLEKRWLPGKKRILEWDDVPNLWSRSSMEFAPFAFWRHWWVKKLGLRPDEHLDLERALRHCLTLFDRCGYAFNMGLTDYFYMGHAIWVGMPQKTEIREIVQKLLALEPKSWK